MDGHSSYPPRGRGGFRGRGFGGGGPMRGRGRGRGGSFGGGPPKTQKLFVGNLPETSEPDSLREVFAKFGNVVECDILGTYGFVHYNSVEEAAEAVKNLHDSDYGGNNIRVEMSNSKVRTQAGMGGSNLCYRCGGIGHMSMDCPSAEENEFEPVRRPRGRGMGGGMGGDMPRGMGGGMPATPHYPSRPAALDPRDDPMYQDYLRERMAARYKPYESQYRPRAPAQDPYATADPYASAAFPTPSAYADPYERPPPEFYATKRGRGGRGGSRGGPNAAASAYQEDSTAAYATGYTGF